MPVSIAVMRALVSDRKAVTALEYGLIASIIFGLILLGFTTLGTALQTFFTGFVALLT